MADTDYGGIISSAATIAAEMAKRRAQGRVEEAGVNQNQSIAEANIFRTRMDAALKGPVQSAQATAIGDTLANVKPFEWTGETKMSGNIPIPQAQGGLTPANYGPLTRQAGADLASQSAGRVKSAAFGLPDVPTLQGIPQAGKLDSILNAAGGIGSIAGAADKGGGNLLGLGKELIDKYRHRNDNIFGGQTTTSGIYDPSYYDPENPDATSGVLPGLPGAGNYGLGSEGRPNVDPGLPGAGNYGMGPDSPPNVDPSLATEYDRQLEAWRRQQEAENNADGAGGSITGTNWWDE